MLGQTDIQTDREHKYHARTDRQDRVHKYHARADRTGYTILMLGQTNRQTHKQTDTQTDRVNKSHARTDIKTDRQTGFTNLMLG